MIRLLRKGSQFVEFTYKHGSDSIQGDTFEAESFGEAATFRFRLWPVDENQTLDARNLDDYPLEAVIIDDSQIMDRLGSFVTSHGLRVNRLEVMYNNRIFAFNVTVLVDSLDRFNLRVDQ